MPVANKRGPKPVAGPEPLLSDSISLWLTTLVSGVEGWLELRALGVRRVASHSGQHTESAVYPISERGFKDLARDARDLTKRSTGVYVTMNPVILPADRTSAKDADVIQRVGLLVDIDPVRPSDTSSTDAELETAVSRAREIREFLSQLGWPDPLIACSGNGAHLRYRVSLPNDDAAKELAKRCLRALDHQFSDESCKVDTSTYNASRIVRLYGTLARKGDDEPGRPHRVSEVLECPAMLMPVADELLRKLAALSPGKPLPKTEPPPSLERKGKILAYDHGDAVSAHARKALEVECHNVSSAPTGARNTTLFRAACAIGELCEAGSISSHEARSALAAAAATAGLPYDEIESCIASAFQKITGHPRDISHVGKRKTEANGVPVEDPSTGALSSFDDPHVLAERHLREWHTSQDGYTLRWWNDSWWTWTRGSWSEIAEKEIAAALTMTARAAMLEQALAVGKAAKPVGTRLISNVIGALRSILRLPITDHESMPFWISGSGPDPRECVCARNCLLHMPTVLASQGDTPDGVMSLTPRLFSANSLTYDFDPKAPEPVHWLKFLSDLWPEDQESIDCLQEWFGYLLTPDTSQQKILLVVGPRRSGKGTISSIITHLVGARNVANPTLSMLATQFGLQGLIGKTVCLSPESRVSGRLDSQAIVERLLSISGEDGQLIDRKHQAAWQGTLNTRIVLLGNELPGLGDYSDALPGRVILLHLEHSFFGREDTDLRAKLIAELPSILVWSMVGWSRLKARGRFVQPASSAKLLNEFNEMSNPVGAFLAECCTVTKDLSVAVPKLYERWRKWCEDNGRDRPGHVQSFCRNLHTAIPGLSMMRPRDDGSRVRVIHGLGLNIEEGGF